MAIAFVQAKINSIGAAAASLSVTLTTGATAGNCLIVGVCYDSGSTGTPTCVTTGGSGSDAFGAPVYTYLGSNLPIRYAVFILPSCGSGRTGATVTFSGANPGFSDLCCWEFSGIASATKDKGVVAEGSSTAPASPTTGTLSNATEIGLGLCGSGPGVSNMSGTGATWAFDGASGNGDGYSHCITSTTAALTATATQATGSWNMNCVTVMPGGAAPVAKAGTMSLMGVG